MIERIACGFLLTTMVLVVACGATRPDPPPGFAPYEGADSFRAVSADGVVYRVRTEPNEPRAELPFWKEALKRRMTNAGYHFVSESDLSTSGGIVYLLDLGAPLGAQDYGYLVAIFVRGERLVIIESAGEAARFRARREAVLGAIEKMRVTSTD
jgi:hypothetical protein